MYFSDDQLISFLLGDADEVLVQQIRQQAAIDRQLADRIGHYRSVLSHLDRSDEFFEPPAGLVDATLQRLRMQLSSQIPSEPATDSGAKRQQPANCERSSTASWGDRNKWSDSIALTFSVTAICCLVLPSIVSARFQARRAQCAENLRLSGTALIAFAIRNENRRFPAVASSGPQAFSGIYAVHLADSQLLDSTSQLQCSSLLGLKQPMTTYLSKLPTLDQVCAASQAHWLQWTKILGGDYAYNLGVHENGRLVPPRNDGRSYFAVLSDAPEILDKGFSIVSHDGRGSNLLYDDGHVSFVVSERLLDGDHSSDHPFHNRSGQLEAGVDQGDASLAPSPYAPLGSNLRLATFAPAGN
ncbi:MAG: hypothetical protein KF752_07355 [Pirellulaceae bacterium]|nr:hypothetical protein [Pirellulaceae bacterium]